MFCFAVTFLFFFIFWVTVYLLIAPKIHGKLVIGNRQANWCHFLQSHPPPPHKHTLLDPHILYSHSRPGLGGSSVIAVNCQDSHPLFSIPFLRIATLARWTCCSGPLQMSHLATAHNFIPSFRCGGLVLN